MRHSQSSKPRTIEVEKDAADALVTAARLLKTNPEDLLQRCIKRLLNKRQPASFDHSESKTSSSP